MYLGIDIGSSTSKTVILDLQGRIAGKSVINAGTGSSGPQKSIIEACKRAGIEEKDIRKCVATGYGRMLFDKADKQITEISCHAKGVIKSYSDVSTIIDIGGQDAKVIRIGKRGNVENFVMNEKCAAGTGRFLEVMARVLGCKLSELSELSDKGKEGVNISSVCTVFAESEMISQLAAGHRLEDVARGAHYAIAQRIIGLGNRIGMKPKIIMTGGVALNSSVVEALENISRQEIIRADDPQIMGALGAALYAMELGLGR